MSRDTYRHHEPLTVAAAEPGWRAVHGSGEPDTAPRQAVPVVGWGVFRVTERWVDTDEVVRTEPNQIMGVVARYELGAVAALVSVADAHGFVHYLAPGDELSTSGPGTRDAVATA